MGYFCKRHFFCRTRLPSGKRFFDLTPVIQRLQQRQLAHQCIPLNNSDLPEAVEQFRNLCPIGNPTMRHANHVEHTYKAVSTLDRITYSIHRVTSLFSYDVNTSDLDARQLTSYARTQIDNWSRITHSNVCRLHTTLLTRAFNDSCKLKTTFLWSQILAQLFVYDFQPLAEPLAKHFYHVNGSLKSKYLSNGITGLNEQIIWNFIIQISSAIRTVHAANMAVRSIDLSRVLVNSSGKFLISGTAIPDVFAEPGPSLISLQVKILCEFNTNFLD